MSRAEQFFNPRSMWRVVQSVEWEDQLHEYRDGTTNQEHWMRALATLWERWIRGYSLLDLEWMAQAAEGRAGWLEAFSMVLDRVPTKIEQLVGFWEGLWMSANPKAAGRGYTFWGLIPGTSLGLPKPLPEPTNAEKIAADLGRMIARLRAVLPNLPAVKEEVPIGEPSSSEG